MVVGSRYVSGGQLDERWSWWRRFLSWWANEVWSRQILGLKTKDITAVSAAGGGPRWLASGWIRSSPNGYAFQVEMTYLAERLGYRVKEIPIFFEDRRIGMSKDERAGQAPGSARRVSMRRRHRKAARKQILDSRH